MDTYHQAALINMRQVILLTPPVGRRMSLTFSSDHDPTLHHGLETVLSLLIYQTILWLLARHSKATCILVQVQLVLFS